MAKSVSYDTHDMLKSVCSFVQYISCVCVCVFEVYYINKNA